MGSSTRTETTTQNTKTEPWSVAQPYYSDLYASAEAARKNGNPTPYPKSTVVDWSQATQDAYNNIEATARAGSPLLSNASNVANNVMTGGAYSGTPISTLSQLQQGLNPQANPYTDMFRSVANGALMNGFGGMQALQAGTGWVNPGIGATVDAAKTINNDAGNALMQNGLNGKNVATGLAAQAAVNAFDNPGTAAFAGQQGYTNGSLGQAQALSNTAGYNPAQAGFASQTGYTNSALGGQQALTGYLAGNNNPATAMLQSTANGDYLNSNPYINTAIKNANQNLVDQFNNQIAPGVDSTMAAAGRLGSNAYASSRNSVEKTLANAMATNSGNMMAANYATERNNQLNAQNQIGNLYNSDVTNLQNSLNSLSTTSNNQQGQRLNALTGLSTTADNATKNAISANSNAANIENQQQAQRLAAIAGMASTADSVNKNSIAGAASLGNIDSTQQQINNAALNSAGNLTNAASQLYLGAANQLGNQSQMQQSNSLNYLNSLSDLYKYDTTNRVNAMYGGANVANQDFANQLSNAQLQLNAANAQAQVEAQRAAQQLQAAAMAGGLRGNDYADANALLGVGQADQSRQGAFLQDDINRWNQSQNAVWTGLQNQANILNGGGFNNTSGTSTKPVYTNNAAQGMGLATSALGMLAK
ncbi:hypothetical protein [Methylobacterium sp.]|uniref:hypothetical protein n=1 Tax=Methylobacterium sp. TaxID=409 RepID=UPI000FB3D1E9|nr:hypothetical protein [Methylobacterium sp.]RUP22652.1 MAG: hypothetical protein EKK44_04075 [Methylobacterium sp.]